MNKFKKKMLFNSLTHSTFVKRKGKDQVWEALKELVKWRELTNRLIKIQQSGPFKIKMFSSSVRNIEFANRTIFVVNCETMKLLTNIAFYVKGNMFSSANFYANHPDSGWLTHIRHWTLYRLWKTWMTRLNFE